jgi:hypothetical protein
MRSELFSSQPSISTCIFLDGHLNPSVSWCLLFFIEALAEIVACFLTLNPEIAPPHTAGEEYSVGLRRCHPELSVRNPVAFYFGGTHAPVKTCVVDVRWIGLPLALAPDQIAQPKHADVIKIEALHRIRTSDLAK